MSSRESSISIPDASSRLVSQAADVQYALTQCQSKMDDLHVYAVSLSVLLCCVLPGVFLPVGMMKLVTFAVTLGAAIAHIYIGSRQVSILSETNATTTKQCVDITRVASLLTTTSLPSLSSNNSLNNNYTICRKCRYINCTCLETPFAATHCIICERHLRDCCCDLQD